MAVIVYNKDNRKILISFNRSHMLFTDNHFKHTFYSQWFYLYSRIFSPNCVLFSKQNKKISSTSLSNYCIIATNVTGKEEKCKTWREWFSKE